jgi:predicted HicB family RNase H-like nuclease
MFRKMEEAKRKPGRPPNVPGETIDRFSVGLSRAVAAELRETALAQGVSSSFFVEGALIREFRRLARKRK